MSPTSNSTAGYRKLYGCMIRLYPKPYRERFGEGMEQTFTDLCCERTGAGKGLFIFALGACIDTLVGIIDERISSIFFSNSMGQKILKLALGTALFLIIPLICTFTVEGFNWTGFDFIFAGVLIFGTGLTYLLITQKARNHEFKYGVGLSLAASFLLVWINGAVGIIGNEDNPANALFLGVILIGLFGSIIGLFQPRGMMRAAFAAAVAQFMVPVIAALYWMPTLEEAPGIIGVFILNMFFVAMWTAAAVLFRQAAQKL